MTVCPCRSRRVAAALVVLSAAACSHPKPGPVLAPAPETAAASAALPPTALAGSSALRAVIQGRTIPAPPPTPARRPARGRTATAPVPAILQLTPTPVAAPDPAAPSSAQLSAGVSLPGYTMPPHGRPTQPAVWWPGVADSVTVRWVIRQRKAAVSLRGTLRGDTLRGDVWYTLLDSGSEFQLGTFTAVRTPAPSRAR
jgi:hypothetical protein